ncbi:hypothetical protein [Methylorubrum extorquens]|uniref:hypothetical protein n=1 Tax=Methylorubrum extorquens TaxID=408 RepID=UPI002237EA59|nr:hypothetical protein [Methylorubrum extorquens]UYW28850.1 hypothetical protein OKC48_10155 [Methylorubrum extorquens]UYW31435.1 hypothetical protein OKB92_21030 [Methylorubrum extorquens]
MKFDETAGREPRRFLVREASEARGSLPSKAETLTVLSGSVDHQHGTAIEQARADAVRTDGFVCLPENTLQALRTTNEPVVLQGYGSGPFGVNEPNPADDPSKAKN